MQIAQLYGYAVQSPPTPNTSNDYGLAYAHTACLNAPSDTFDDTLFAYIDTYQHMFFTKESVEVNGYADLNVGLDLALCNIYYQTHQYGHVEQLLRSIIESVEHSNRPENCAAVLEWYIYIDHQLQIAYQDPSKTFTTT